MTLVNKYYEELVRAEDKRAKMLALRRFLIDATGVSLEYSFLGKLLKVYNESIVFNAILASVGRNFNSNGQQLKAFLIACCKNEVKRNVLENARMKGRKEFRRVDENFRERVKHKKGLNGANTDTEE